MDGCLGCHRRFAFLESVVIGTSLMATSDFVVFETDESNG